MIEVKNLSEIEALALGKALDEKELDAFRKGVGAGVHTIDVLIHLQGELRVGVASFANQPNKLDLWTLIAVLADRLRPETFATIVEDLCAKQAAGEPLFDKDQIEKLKEATQEQMKKLLGTTRQERRGPVQFEGTAVKSAVKSGAKTKVEKLNTARAATG